MTHFRHRKFNTKDTYPEQKLDNDLCHLVATRGGTTLWFRGACPQDLDTSESLMTTDAAAQTHKVMQNIKQLIEEAGGRAVAHAGPAKPVASQLQLWFFRPYASTAVLAGPGRSGRGAVVRVEPRAPLRAAGRPGRGDGQGPI